MEERALSLWGREVVDGVANIGVLGLEVTTEQDGIITPSPGCSSSTPSLTPLPTNPFSSNYRQTAAAENATTTPARIRQRKQPESTASQKLQQSLSDGDTRIADALLELSNNVKLLVDQQSTTNKLLQTFMTSIQNQH